MNKKIFLFAIITLILCFTASCSFGGAGALYKSGMEAFDDENYELAESKFLSAIEKNYDKNNIKIMYDIVYNYNNALECLDKENYKDAEKFLNDIPKEYRKYDIKEEIDDLEEIIEEYNKNINLYDNIISYAENELYDLVERTLPELDTRYLDGNQKKEITSVYKKIAEAKKKERTLETGEKDATYEINSLLNKYAWGLVDAINTGDFLKVSDTLYPGSSIYSSQKNLVEKLSIDGTKQEMLSLSVKSINKTSDSTYTIITYEVCGVYEKDGTYKTKINNFKYTAKLYDGALKLTSISKS